MLTGKQTKFCSHKCKGASTESNKFAVTKWRREQKAKAVAYLGGKCCRCGYQKSIWALDFHHKDPAQKDFGISSGDTRSLEKVKRELDKCLLLCRNCHSEEHERLFYLSQVVAVPAVAPVLPSLLVEVAVPCSLCAELQVPSPPSSPPIKKKKQPAWPTDADLSKQLWETPATTVAHQLGVSSSAVKKRCRERGIATPPRGYWAKQKSSSMSR